PASVHRRTVRHELGPHHGDFYRDRDRSGDRDRLPRSTETASPSATVPADPAGPTGPTAVATRRSSSIELANSPWSILGSRVCPVIGHHTSELQSPDHLVCRLLLEKKKPP